MEPYEKVLHFLDELQIQYKIVEHPAAMTTEEADRYIEGYEGVRTKTLFLCNKKSRNFYLIVMDDKKYVDMKTLEGLLEDKGLHFCSAEKLMAKMGIEPGMVSIFGLLNNEEKDIQVILDQRIMDQQVMTFHPNDNTKTVFISTEGMLGFLDATGYVYRVMKL